MMKTTMPTTTTPHPGHATRAPLAMVAIAALMGASAAHAADNRERGWRVRAEIGADAGLEGGDSIGTGRPIDAGVDGVGPLATSLRIRPLDLRKSASFGNVYSYGQGSLVASSGALHAVFPRSVYVTGREVPPGTVFYIGSTPGRFSPTDARPGEPIGPIIPKPASAVGEALDLRIDLMADDRVGRDGVARDRRRPAPERPATSSDASAPSAAWVSPIWDDRRPRRVAELLDRAARAVD